MRLVKGVNVKKDEEGSDIDIIPYIRFHYGYIGELHGLILHFTFIQVELFIGITWGKQCECGKC